MIHPNIVQFTLPVYNIIQFPFLAQLHVRNCKRVQRMLDLTNVLNYCMRSCFTFALNSPTLKNLKTGPQPEHFGDRYTTLGAQKI